MCYQAIEDLLGYALRTGLIEECDRTWAANRLLQTLGLESWEPPQTVRERPLEDILTELLEDAAARELLEETGYRAGKLEFLMKTAPNAANSTAYAYCYLATDAEWAAKQHLDEMEDVAVEFMDLKDVRKALRDGVFEQAVHVAALYAALDILDGRNDG